MEYLPDIYQIADKIYEIQKKFIDVDDDVSVAGIYGYLNDVHSNSLQNAIMLAAEYGNEALPIRSKFERTILTNAITYDIQDINAKPARMTVMLGFVKSSLDKYMDDNANTFIYDRYSTIQIEKYKFHLDYDIVIHRSKLMNGSIVYTAKYDMNYENPLSIVKNPYLQSPIITVIERVEYLFVICDIAQTEIEFDNHKVITSNALESKTFDFTFDNQLCYFNIFVTENGKKTELIPVYEGLPYEKSNNYCYYTYIDSNQIRVKFDRHAYQPLLNAEIDVEIYTTLGTAGNFQYNELLLLPMVSDRFDYRNIKGVVQPMTDSTNGTDRKTMEELQKIIPKRMLARGGIICDKDLQNYFDTIDDENRLVVYKKRDNQIERLYYAYLLAKDENQNIVPTNTINIQLDAKTFDNVFDDRYVLVPGRKIYYDKNMVGYYDPNKIAPPEQLEKCKECGCLHGERHPIFEYATPFITIINKQPLSISYYLDLINREYTFSYDYVNQHSELQFIATTISMYKNFIIGDEYVFTMNITQNVNAKSSVVVYVKDEDGKDMDIVDYFNMKVVLVMESNKHKYLVFGDIIDYKPKTQTFTIEFRIPSDHSLINKQNQIKLTNLIANTENEEKDYFIDRKIKLSAYVYLNKDVEDVGIDTDYTEDINSSLLDGMVLVNKYYIEDDVFLFYNYSANINSICKVYPPEENTEPPKEDTGTETPQDGDTDTPDGDGGEEIINYKFELQSIPMIRYSYLMDELRLNEFIDYLQYRKNYIDMAQRILEDTFNVDLKFFNTYGPSLLFNIGRHNQEVLDSVNISLNFDIKLNSVSTTEILFDIKDSIKSQIENINQIDSVHMSNICAYIKQEYSNDIDFIEFTGLNTYNAMYQYLEHREPDVLLEVPEFITVNLNDDMEADINITVI